MTTLTKAASAVRETDSEGESENGEVEGTKAEIKHCHGGAVSM